MTDRGALYPKLGADAQDLYDFVEKNLPTGEQSSFPFGVDHPGARRDGPFRSLIRAVVEGSVEPRGWMRGAWADEEVAKACRDPDVLRHAWALLNEGSHRSWTATWRRRVRNDRNAILAVWITLVIGGTLSFVTESGWPLGGAVMLVLLVLGVASARIHGKSRTGDERTIG